MSVKRLRYFTHQFLQEKDFKDEQQYHIDMRRRHNKLFHRWGIVEGLEVQRKGDREISISPGMALDREGREMVLLDAVTRDLGSVSRDSELFVTMAYGEQGEGAGARDTTELNQHTRTSETPVFAEQKARPPADGAVVTLARVRINELGHVGEVDMEAGLRQTALLPSPAAGWVRLPFKPYRLNPVKVSGKLVKIVSEEAAEERDFIVDEATAYCGDEGARGSMGIPVPPAAVELTGFRIAGTSRGSVTVHIYRTGWNRKDNRGENTRVLEATFREEKFHQTLHAKVALDESHALGVSVFADAETAIWLVAARFA